MIPKTIARRYVDGFLKQVEETVGRESSLEEFKNVKYILLGSPEMMKFLENPTIAPSPKYRLIDTICQKRFSASLKHFLYFLIRKRRINLLPEMINDALKRYARGEGIDAVLRISFPLDLETLSGIKKKLEEKINRRLKLYVHLDGELLGGIHVTAGNISLDNSLKGALQELRERLMQVRV